MSTIVIVRKGDRAVMAADSLSTYGSLKFGHDYHAQSDKIQKIGANFVGIAGAAVHASVLASLARKHPKSLVFDNEAAIFDSLVRIHPILKKEFFLNADPEGDDPYEASRISFVVANASGIFGVGWWRTVSEYRRFWAIGSGSDYALGAMFAVYDRLETPEEIARVGVAAGAEFDNGSGMPMTLYSVDLNPSAPKKARGKRGAGRS
jgi:ATP-dependent HslUV protease, peptidase subunit HslV